MKKRKLLAPFLMLSAGAVAGIAMFNYKYELREMLGILILVLTVFYILGILIAKMLDRFERQNEKIASEKEGEVIEKETDQEQEPESEEE